MEPLPSANAPVGRAAPCRFRETVRLCKKSELMRALMIPPCTTAACHISEVRAVVCKHAGAGPFHDRR
jgi:hypothetical protein